ncbi:ABC transporter permease [Paenibacillus sp. 1P07SE]|uniref:ABC transporter permease n=1 Tax=Paenibacillus sp. 1P07SE TaxID=3132209 RepID=UPI0039A63718
MKSPTLAPSMMSAIRTFAWRSLTKTMKIPVYVLIDTLVFPVIFLLIFTFLFGGAIAGSTGTYLQFLLPGMLVYTVTTMTVYTGIGIQSDLAKGVFSRFRTLPFWQPAAIIGAMAIDVLRYVLAVTATASIGMLLGFRPEAGAVGLVLALLAVVLFAFSVSWIFACLGVIIQKAEALTTSTYLVLYPLMFTSNVFVDSSTMPGWLRPMVEYNPLSLAATGVRGLAHGTAEASDLLWLFAGCAALIAVFAPLTFRLYRIKGNE